MKRLGRKTQRALALSLAIAIAVLGLLLLAGDDSPFEADLAPRGGDVSGVKAPRVTFDEGPHAAPVSSATSLGSPKAPSAKPDDANHGAPKVEGKVDGPPGVVTGRVVDREGTGVFGATVEVGRMQRRGRPNRNQLKTDRFGNFSVEVNAGRYWVNASHPDFARSKGEWFQLGSGKTKTLELVVPPSSALVGTVLAADGRPIAGAKVSLGGRRNEQEAKTNASGEFRLEGLREGLYRVSASSDGYVRGSARDVPVVEGSGGRVTFTLQVGGELSGVLRKPDGAPLSRGLVFAHRESGRPAMTRSDKNGQYRLTGLEEGKLTLFARSEDYGLSVRTTTVVVPGLLAVQDLVLAEGPRVEGVLRRASGEGLADTNVVARSKIGDVVRRGKSDAEGRFTVKNLYPGHYELQVGGNRRGWGRQGLLTQEFEANAGVVTLELTVPDPVLLGGTVRDGTGAVVDRANVYAIVGEDYRGQARTDETGRFELKNLPADSYRLFVRVGDDRLVGLGAAELREGETLDDLELIVRPPAKLRGQVLDSAGRPAVGVVLDVRGGGESPVRREATTDAEGRFELGPLYDGSYELKAREGSLALLALKLQVETLTLETLSFDVNLGKDVSRDLILH
jgi:hypothetical protein